MNYAKVNLNAKQELFFSKLKIEKPDKIENMNRIFELSRNIIPNIIIPQIFLDTLEKQANYSIQPDEPNTPQHYIEVCFEVLDDVDKITKQEFKNILILIKNLTQLYQNNIILKVL